MIAIKTTLPGNQDSAVFHSRAVNSRKCVTQIYRALYGDAMFVPFQRRDIKIGGRDVIKICTLELRHNEKTNASSSASTV